MDCPRAEAPKTQTVRFRWGGRTGSHEACALAGRRLEPSASTNTKSAACYQPGKSGAVSLPSGVNDPAQTMGLRADAGGLPPGRGAAVTAMTGVSRSLLY